MKICKKINSQGAFHGTNQRGVTLIVVLVILTAMTFLGLSSMSDSNLQLSMVRNDQLEKMAYNAAMTEINAQISLINDPTNGTNDPSLKAVVAATASDANGDGVVLETQIGTDNADFGELVPSIMDSKVTDNITQQLTLTQPNPAANPVIPGFSIRDDSGFKLRLFEINSVVQIDGTATSSNQVQGIRYLGAGSAN